ncbi:MAG: 3'-5' exonuclease [Gammaproteobacteria bacterium]
MRAPLSRTAEATPAGADTLVVLDFETTGLSPDQGDRAIEIGAVLIRNGELADRFQALMNPGFAVSEFIADYTGITNDMLADAPPCHEVMHAFADFLGNHAVVAHNASFDRRFLTAEFSRIGKTVTNHFACSMLIARRLYQDAPNHKLGTLVRFRGIKHDGTFHRALADAEMTAQLWLAMLEDIRDGYALEAPSFSVMQQLARAPKSAVAALLDKNLLRPRRRPVMTR